MIGSILQTIGVIFAIVGVALSVLFVYLFGQYRAKQATPRRARTSRIVREAINGGCEKCAESFDRSAEDAVRMVREGEK